MYICYIKNLNGSSMKVDKAVCTKDTQKDLTKTIQYETVFTTLIENKISAIKRECEDKNKKTKRQKQSKTFGKIFFGRRIFGSNRKTVEDDVNDNNDDRTNMKGYLTTSSTSTTNKASEVVIDIEKDEIKSATKIIDNQIDTIGEDTISKITTIMPTSTATTFITTAAITTGSGYENILQEGKIKTEIESDDETSITIRKFSKSKNSIKDDSNGSNDNGSLDEKGIKDLVVEVITHREGQPYYDDNGDGCDVIRSSKNDNKNETIEVRKLDEHNIETSSLGSIRIDESTNADDSLTSIKDSIESLSFPSSYCTISAGAATVSNEHECSRLRVLEAKSISAQCSPILPRQSKPPPTIYPAQIKTYQYPEKLKSQVSYSDNHGDNYDYHNHDALRFFSRQNTSEDSVNLTVSTLLHEADSINALGERKSKSTSLLVITDKDNKKAINRLDSNNIVSNQSNPLVRGFISSLSQLTTTANYFPVITTTITALRSKTLATKATTNNSSRLSNKLTALITSPTTLTTATAATTISTVNPATTTTTTTTALVTASIGTAPTTTTISSCDTSKLQRMTSTSTGSSVAPTGCCNTKAFSKEKDKRQKPLWQTGQSGSDDEYRKRKRKYSKYDRNNLLN